MQQLPHHYRVSASAPADGDVVLESPRLPTLLSAPPAEFGGPGDHWSPETLLLAALADCFILTFRSVARAAKLPWLSLRCDVEGTLERVERATRFTRFVLSASLDVPEGTSPNDAQRALERAKGACLISSSLVGTTHLDAVVTVAGHPS
ncbi:MAG TPA: OsmC family protein [Polyangiaceae bacterium]|jgi:organic hydroperoxide reductase OsmC/OhrA|nr:OsmC family protein [Polyangiaceae bacterium]